MGKIGKKYKKTGTGRIETPGDFSVIFFGNGLRMMIYT
jgi:hypothetical protein